MQGIGKKLNNLVGEPGEDKKPTGMVADLHNMLGEQTKQLNVASLHAQRLDQLLGYIGTDRERQAQQQASMDQILAAANKQREETATLLQAVATDLTEEIKGERVRFIENMREATSMNMQTHVEEFKKALTQETQRSLKELGQMREQKKALEQQIADLFALKAKHSDEVSLHHTYMKLCTDSFLQPPKPAAEENKDKGKENKDSKDKGKDAKAPAKAPAKGQAPPTPASTPRALPVPPHK
jgi:hypothetical protein